MRIGSGIVVLLLSGLVWAEEGVLTAEDVLEKGVTIARVASVATGVGVRLEEGGRLMIKKDNRWRAATLEEFSTHLRHSAVLYDKGRQAHGESGFTAHHSRLVVEFEAHPETPWRHVCWVMTVCMEENFQKVRLKVGDRAVTLLLPRNSSALPPTPDFMAKVDILAGREVEAKWGEVMINKPTTVTYRVGDEEVQDLAHVSKYLEKVKKDAAAAKKGGLFVGVLMAMHKVPVDRVVDVFDAFLRAGIQRGDFIGRAIPRKSDRRVKVLRYPG